MPSCSDCGKVTKSDKGMVQHRRAQHPEPEVVSVEAAVRRDLAGNAGSEGLQASAVTLAAKLDESTSARDLPGLAAELRATLTLLGVAEREEEGKDTVDDLAARRVARFADAKDHVRPASGGQRRR